MSTLDYALAVRGMMLEGASELEARQTVMARGGNLTSLAPLIDRERSKEQAKADREAESAYLRTVEGKRDEAARLREEREARANLAADARELLDAHGVGSEGMSDDEAIAYAKLDGDEAPDLSNDLNANLKAAGWINEDGSDAS